MLERRGPMSLRASMSARRCSPFLGRPIGTSTPTAAASSKRSSSAGIRRSSTASANRPSSSATAIQPPRAASTPSVSTWAEPFPDQVDVREQEADREERKRRKAAAPVGGDREGRTKGQGHQQPVPTRPKHEPRRRRQEQREEEEVREPEVGGVRLPGEGKRERKVVREHMLVLRHDHVGRPERREHRVRFDERDDDRDEDDQ